MQNIPTDYIAGSSNENSTNNSNNNSNSKIDSSMQNIPTNYIADSSNDNSSNNNSNFKLDSSTSATRLLDIFIAKPESPKSSNESRILTGSLSDLSPVDSISINMSCIDYVIDIEDTTPIGYGWGDDD